MREKKDWQKDWVQQMKENPEIDDSVIEFFLSEEEKFILGNGRQACVALEICRNLGIPIKGIIISDTFFDTGRRQGYWKALYETTEKFSLADISDRKKSAHILMTVGAKNYEVCETMLKEQGFHYIFRCAWGSNSNLRKLCFQLYQKQWNAWKCSVSEMKPRCRTVELSDRC